MTINHDRSRISRLTTSASRSCPVLGITVQEAEKKNEAIRVELGLRDFFRGRIDFSLRKRSTDPSMAGALQYLESQRNAQPELADWYGALADLYQRKLWHQLTIKLEQFVALAVFRVDLFSISSAPPCLLLGFEVVSLTIGLVFCLDPYDSVMKVLGKKAGINSLTGTKMEWLYHILQAFNAGHLIRYQELRRIHNAALNAQPALVENEKKLLEKINILCLMEIIFRSFCAFVHLIEGIIDQVEGTVHVSWVQPRVLGIPQIKSLRDHLDAWVGKVRTALTTKKETENPSGITLFSVPAQWKLSTTAVAVGLALQSHGGLGLNPKSTILKPLVVLCSFLGSTR
ncbi:26S proteasome non-atpase regulatory [Musa troglodytarum]|uniref:26S proteasome non-atpase regulatory n=1 Tax=Musa troglodytarum TaxID=320322 RepID=A0A9E7JPX9_9LILI|nr:26S proteasome non-atpase regulatory [Musa troglodytarum]